MNEFEGKTKEQLLKMLLGLQCYKQGLVDYFNFTEDYYKKSLELYDEKISLCEKCMLGFD